MDKQKQFKAIIDSTEHWKDLYEVDIDITNYSNAKDIAKALHSFASDSYVMFEFQEAEELLAKHDPDLIKSYKLANDRGYYNPPLETLAGVLYKDLLIKEVPTIENKVGKLF